MRKRATLRSPARRRSRHDPRRQDATVVSEEAFTKARRLVSLGFWQALFTLLGERFEASHGGRIRRKGFRLLALDGTEIKLPRWKRLAEYFGTSQNGKEKQSPQARLVLLQFPLARIPYRYELSPKDVGEKTLASRLIEHLRPKLQNMNQTLITASPQRVSRVLLPRLLARIAEYLVPQTPRTPLHPTTRCESENHRQRGTTVAQQAANQRTETQKRKNASRMSKVSAIGFYPPWRFQLADGRRMDPAPPSYSAETVPPGRVGLWSPVLAMIRTFYMVTARFGASRAVPGPGQFVTILSGPRTARLAATLPHSNRSLRV